MLPNQSIERPSMNWSGNTLTINEKYAHLLLTSINKARKHGRLLPVSIDCRVTNFISEDNERSEADIPICPTSSPVIPVKGNMVGDERIPLNFELPANSYEQPQVSIFLA